MWQRAHHLLVSTLVEDEHPRSPGSRGRQAAPLHRWGWGAASTQRPSGRAPRACPRWGMAPAQPALLHHGSRLQTHPDTATAGCQVPPAPAQPAAETPGWANEPSLDANILPPLAGGSGGLCQAVGRSQHRTVRWSPFRSCAPYTRLPQGWKTLSRR